MNSSREKENNIIAHNQQEFKLQEIEKKTENGFSKKIKTNQNTPIVNEKNKTLRKY